MIKKLIIKNDLEKFAMWENIVPFEPSDEIYENEKFEATNLEDILKSDIEVKTAIRLRLFEPHLLLQRCEDLFGQLEMKQRVKRLIDILDSWEDNYP